MWIIYWATVHTVKGTTTIRDEPLQVNYAQKAYESSLSTAIAPLVCAQDCLRVSDCVYVCDSAMCYAWLLRLINVQ